LKSPKDIPFGDRSDDLIELSQMQFGSPHIVKGGNNLDVRTEYRAFASSTAIAGS
jgi:hypothetical protein